MGLRDLAESQLKCKQEADAAEHKARQLAYMTESVAMCTEWFLSVLKTKPTQVLCTSEYNGYEPQHRCRVLCDDEWFEWADTCKRFVDRYEGKPEGPGVRILDEKTDLRGNPKWEPAVYVAGYIHPKYATDLPSLGAHMRAADKARAKG